MSTSANSIMGSGCTPVVSFFHERHSKDIGLTVFENQLDLYAISSDAVSSSVEDMEEIKQTRPTNMRL
jgi:hypothetical protein